MLSNPIDLMHVLQVYRACHTASLPVCAICSEDPQNSSSVPFLTTSAATQTPGTGKKDNVEAFSTNYRHLAPEMVARFDNVNFG